MKYVRAAIAASMIAVAAGSAFGADKYWGSGGTLIPMSSATWLVFNGTSWVPTTAPTASDRAIFDYAAQGLPSGTVNTSLTASRGSSSLVVRGDAVQLDLGGFTYSTGGQGINLNSINASNASLSLLNGTMRTTESVRIDRAGAGASNLSVGAGGMLLADRSIHIGNTIGTAGMSLFGGGFARAEEFFDVGLFSNGSLSVFSGSQAQAGIRFVIASQTGSTGTVTAGGNGALIAAPDLDVGLSGVGSLTVSSGADLSLTQSLLIGNNAGSQGQMFVSGAGTGVQVNFLFVGRGGTGTLNVNTSASVTVSSALEIGHEAGATGTMNVLGIGTQLTTTDLAIGRRGTGTLLISGDPTTSITTGAFLGVDASGAGTLDIRNATATIPSLSVGLLGSGTLALQGAASLTTTVQACIGCELGSDGLLTAAEANTRLLGRFINIPFFGEGTATISSGATIGTAPLPNPGLVFVVGSQVGSVGNVTFRDAGSALVALDQIPGDGQEFGFVVVGDFGEGSLSLRNGATANARFLYIASQRTTNARSEGSVLITGAGSFFNGLTETIVGVRGDGYLYVEDGGRIDTGTMALGSFGGIAPPANDARAYGLLRITGPNSRVNASISTQVGVVGEGSLTITNGGVLSNNFGTVGFTGTGSALVSGTGSLWSNTTNINVGRNAGSFGSLTITQGASVTSGQAFWIGENGGSQGVVNVFGGGSLLRARDLQIGQSGNGSIGISDGAVQLISPGADAATSHVARDFGAFGSALVSAGGVFNSNGMLSIATGGTGSFELFGGGVATIAGLTRIGTGSFAEGTLSISDPGSRFECQSPIEVGAAGQALVNVLAGGTLRAPTLLIGPQPLSDDPLRQRVVVDSTNAPAGQSSTLDITSQIVVGGTATTDGARASLLLNTLAPIAPTLGVHVRAPGVLEVGAAILNAPLTSSGRIAAASPDPMRLTVNGTLTQSPESLMGLPARGELELRLLGQGDFDQIVVNGPATLGGALVVTRDPAFQPGPGGFSADLLIAQDITRRFDVVYFTPELVGANAQTIQYLDGAGRGLDAVRVGSSTLPNLPVLLPPGTGTQTAQVSGTPTQAAAADLNGDSFLDVVAAIPRSPGVPDDTGAIAVIFNLGINPDRTWRGFADPVYLFAGVDPVGVALGDLFPGNGPDIAVINKGDSTAQNPPGLRLFRNIGAGVFTPFGEPQPVVFEIGLDPRSIAIANFVDDPLDLPDIAVSSLDEVGDGQIVVRPNALANASNPTLLPPRKQTTSGPPGTIEPGGLDNPKEINDLAVCIPGNPGQALRGLDVFINAGPTANEPVFLAPIPLTVGLGPTAIAVADLDNDNDADLITADTLEDTVSIALNQLGVSGAGSPFRISSLPVPPQPRSLAVLDLDADTDLDIAVVARSDAGTQNVVRVLRNDTAFGSDVLVFALAASIGEGTDPQYILAGNVDGDPDPDIIAFTEPPALPEREATAYVNAFCFGDPNRDRVVDLADLSILLSNFGTSTPTPNTLGDANGNTVVETRDLIIMLARFGTTCP
ncbi:MAG: hypothetical protein ACKVZJ_14750 [Phycisphaerales bacterium]